MIAAMVAASDVQKTDDELLEHARWLCKHALKGRLWFEDVGRYDASLGRSVPLYRIFRRGTGFVAKRSTAQGLIAYLRSQSV